MEREILNYFFRFIVVITSVITISCSKRVDGDLQYAQTIQINLAYYIMLDAVDRKIDKPKLFDGLLSTSEINGCVPDGKYREKIYELIKRRWRLDSRGNFTTKSGSPIYLNVAYSKPYVSVKMKLYENYNTYIRGVCGRMTREYKFEATLGRE